MEDVRLGRKTQTLPPTSVNAGVSATLLCDANADRVHLRLVSITPSEDVYLRFGAPGNPQQILLTGDYPAVEFDIKFDGDILRWPVYAECGGGTAFIGVFETILHEQ